MSVISGIAGLTSDEVIALIGRNKPDGTAGLYDCKTILNEHRPVCTKEYHLTGIYLDNGNPDVWFPIPGAGGGTIVYTNRFLTLTSGTGTDSATRCVIDQTKFPITGNFAEVTCRIGAMYEGVGGIRDIQIGFRSAFSSNSGNERICFRYLKFDSKWFIVCNDTSVLLTDLPFGRELQSGDVVTVRLDRQEGSPNIDIARFYVNGQKVYETLNIPTVDCYAGIGVFSDEDTTTPVSISIDYFGCKFVP